MSIEILVYAAIAAFLLSRLWAVLGQRHDDEPQRPNPFARQAQGEHDEDDSIILPGRGEDQAGKSPLEPGASIAALPAPESLAGGLQKLRELDYLFTEKQFLQGAKAAFAMIVGDFARGDMAAVEYLLSPKIAAQFRTAIAARREAGQTLEHKLLGVDDADTTSVRLDGSRAYIGVRFISKQENILRDATGNIISGTPGRNELIEDEWVFSRDMKTADPNWVVVETKG